MHANLVHAAGCLSYHYFSRVCKPSLRQILKLFLKKLCSSHKKLTCSQAIQEDEAGSVYVRDGRLQLVVGDCLPCLHGVVCILGTRVDEPHPCQDVTDTYRTPGRQKNNALKIIAPLLKVIAL